ncbi:MAG: divalent metal cation transporter [Thermoplasmatales archaeon]|jgi:Mn2+/Fe2+ NRAMP family transporter|nr:divalent metal cation transporter [Candidatus Thermoplasmatota archaeon]MDA8055016.1 divalent metal cation transporter [Thermoplasmatales archaeon]
MNSTLKKLLPVLGPGWVVMLADLDAPSVITAVQSGIEFKAHLIIFLIVLIIPLFLVQDTSSRIGAVTGKTLGQVISEYFGHGWTIAAVSGTAIIDFAAYVGEFAGIALAASLIGIPVVITVIFVIIVHTLVVVTGKYKKIEIFLVGLGFLLFLFVVLDFFVYPHNIHIADFSPFVPSSSFYFLLAANVGAVIMPWMLFYHQAADVDSGLKISGMKKESWGTLQGAIASEVLMVAIVIFSWRLAQDGYTDGNSMTYVAVALQQEIGPIGPIIFAVALGVAGLLAMFVISMSMSYSLSDVFRMGGTFNKSFGKQKKFYGIYLLEIIPAAILTLLFTDLISLALDIMVLSAIALALPLMVVIRIGSSKKIMGEHRIGKPRTIFLYAFMIAVVGLGIFSILQVI